MHSQLLLNLVEWSFASYRDSKTNRLAHWQGVWRCALLKSACPRMPLREKERGIKTERERGGTWTGHHGALGSTASVPFAIATWGWIFFKRAGPCLVLSNKGKGREEGKERVDLRAPSPSCKASLIPRSSHLQPELDPLRSSTRLSTLCFHRA